MTERTQRRNTRANARLIAAAPDLLAALELVSAGLRNGCVKAKPILTFKPNAKTLPLESLDSIVDAALAKARA